MKLSAYYKQALVLPAIFVLFFCVAYAGFNNLEDGWPAARSAMMMSGISSLIFILLMFLLSLPIFLNKIKKLQAFMIWNVLTFFLLPLIYIAAVWIHDLTLRLSFGFGFGDDFFYLLLMTVPFIAGLCLSFGKFRRQLPQTNTD